MAHTLAPEERAVHRAWWSLALFAPSFVAAFAVGEGLASVYGYPSGATEVPAWVALAAGLPACAVFAAPLLVTWLLARPARDRPDARYPVLVAAAVSLFFVAQNLLGWCASRVAGW